MATRYEQFALRGYRSIGEAGLNLPATGLVGVYGRNLDGGGLSSNGTGKSSLLGGFQWVLFGVADRSRAAAHSVVGRHVDTDCEGALTFVPADGHRYKVQRTRTRKAKHVLKLWRNDELVSSADPDETQRMINRALGTDVNGFQATAFFTQAMRFGDLTDAGHKKILERIVDDERFDRACKVLGKDADGAKDAVNTAAAEEVRATTVARERKAVLDGYDRDAATAEARWACRREDRRQTHARAELAQVAKVEAAKAARASIERDRAGIEMALQAERDEAERLGQELAALPVVGVVEDPELADRIGRTIKHRQAVGHQLAQIRGHLKVAKDAALRHEAAAAQAASRVGRPCGECGRPLTEAEIGAVHKAAVTAAEAATEEARQLALDEAALAPALARIDALEAELVGQQRARMNAQASAASGHVQRSERLRQLQSSTHGRQAQLRALESTAERAYAAAADASGMTAAALVELSREEQTIAGERQAQAARKAEVVQLVEAAGMDAQAKAAALATARRALERLEYLRGTFGLRGLRSAVLSDIMPALNEELRKLLVRVTDGLMSVTVASTGERKDGTEDGKIEVSVSTAFGGGDYTELSKGERARIDMMILLALREVAVKRRGFDPGILVLDEILDDVEPEGVARIMPLLYELAERSLVFIVSHQIQASSIPTRINVVKQGGVATVTLGAS